MDILSNFLLKQPLGFRNGYSAQYFLLIMLEKWRNTVDKGKCFRALLTNLFKVYDYLPYQLLIEKLHSYGFNLRTLKLFRGYLSKKKRRTKINSTRRSWIFFGVP